MHVHVFTKISLYVHITFALVLRKLIVYLGLPAGHLQGSGSLCSGSIPLTLQDPQVRRPGKRLVNMENSGPSCFKFKSYLYQQINFNKLCVKLLCFSIYDLLFSPDI